MMPRLEKRWRTCHLAATLISYTQDDFPVYMMNVERVV